MLAGRQRSREDQLAATLVTLTGVDCSEVLTPHAEVAEEQRPPSTLLAPPRAGSRGEAWSRGGGLRPSAARSAASRPRYRSRDGSTPQGWGSARSASLRALRATAQRQASETSIRRNSPAVIPPEGGNYRDGTSWRGRCGARSRRTGCRTDPRGSLRPERLQPLTVLRQHEAGDAAVRAGLELNPRVHRF